VQAQVRRRLLHVFVRRGRLRRHCAWPPFALDRMRELAPERFVYDHPKPGPGGSLTLTLLQSIDRLGAPVPTA
jgi:hypothetical protein